MTQIRVIDPQKWDELGNEGKRPAHKAVKVGEAYSVSPDGWGAYFYETLEELVEDYFDLEDN
jgi:regulator of RNase E activity RraB